MQASEDTQVFRHENIAVFWGSYDFELQPCCVFEIAAFPGLKRPEVIIKVLIEKAASSERSCTVHFFQFYALSSLHPMQGSLHAVQKLVGKFYLAVSRRFMAGNVARNLQDFGKGDRNLKTA